MNRIKKAPKTNRNQPPEFAETLAAPLLMPTEAFGNRRLTLRQIRLGLGVIWVAAALLAGIGVGRIIKDAVSASVIAEPPVPVATASVSVANTASESIVPGQSVSTAALHVVPADASITQAQTGNIFSTLALVAYQTAQPANALQPGFTQFSRTQGNIGTAPAR